MDDTDRRILKAMVSRGNTLQRIEEINKNLDPPLDILELQSRLLKIAKYEGYYVKIRRVSSAGGNGVASASLNALGRQYLRDHE
jgi:hypothetical protein